MNYNTVEFDAMIANIACERQGREFKRDEFKKHMIMWRDGY